MGDADYILAFQKIVMPIALEFSPDLVISSSLSRCIHSQLLIPLQSLQDLTLPKATTSVNATSPPRATPT